MPFRILILGGGFAGLEAARRLATDRTAEVTLLDPSSHALFTPRLVDALAGRCRERDLRAAHADLAQRHGYRFLQGTACEIRHHDHAVDWTDVSGHSANLAYDTLICAYGAETNFYGTPGKERAFALKTWGHLVRLEERLARLARESAVPRIAIVGGGATGIEAACALDLRLHALGKAQGERAITVFQAGPQILPGFLPNTVAKAGSFLAAQGIAVRTGAAIQAVEEGGLALATGERVAADLVLWCAGVRPNAVPGDVPTEAKGGALTVDFALRAAPGLFGGGDAASVHDAQRPVPKNAQTALKMGTLLAENVRRERAGRPLAPFRYRSPGVMLWLGTTAITDLFGLSLRSSFFLLARNLFYGLRWKRLRG